jgi:hypothetical protein
MQRFQIATDDPNPVRTSKRKLLGHRLSIRRVSQVMIEVDRCHQTHTLPMPLPPPVIKTDLPLAALARRPVAEMYG